MSNASSSDRSAFLYVVTSHPRATQTFIQAEIDGLRSRGETVHVVALNEPAPDQLKGPGERREYEQTTYLRSAGLPAAARSLLRALRVDARGVARVALDALSSGGADLRRILWRLFHLGEALIVWDHATSLGVRHIHAHFGQSTSTIAWLAVRLAEELGQGPTDLVITIHCGTEIEDRRETIPHLKIQTARAIVAVSDHTRSQIMRQVPSRFWPRIRVIRCGIDLDFFGSLERASTTSSEPPTILFVGRLDPVKGVPILLDACDRLVEKGVDLRLEIVGGGSLSAELEQRASGRPWVSFDGELPPSGVRDRLRQADIFCLPSLDEGIPVSIMEAMAVGVPVVATAVAGVPELALDDETAVVVPAGNVDALAAGLERLLLDPERRARLSEAARKRVAELHDVAVNLPQLIALIGDEADRS